ncbi:hypothetical protein M6G08_30585 [Streptomyces sp. M92]|nr:hypothetical protein M6G08_30585 [Streptomyces sp. M92]
MTTNHASIWPLPPPFMQECLQCRELRLSLIRQADAPAGCWYEREALSRHIASDHPGEVPAAHAKGCQSCPSYALEQDSTSIRLWAEHRARDLFMPAHVARLM